jgi:excisionase family DNA binding protein
MPRERWLHTKDIAEQLKIHVETVRRWLRTGVLRGVNMGGKGGYRIRERDLREFLHSKENRDRMHHPE